MLAAITYTAYQLSNPHKTVSMLIAEKVRQFLPQGITATEKETLINLYRCTSCDPIYRISFYQYPEIRQMQDMKAGIIPYADVAFLISLPNNL